MPFGDLRRDQHLEHLRKELSEGALLAVRRRNNRIRSLDGKGVTMSPELIEFIKDQVARRRAGGVWNKDSYGLVAAAANVTGRFQGLLTAQHVRNVLLGRTEEQTEAPVPPPAAEEQEEEPEPEAQQKEIEKMARTRLTEDAYADLTDFITKAMEENPEISEKELIQLANKEKPHGNAGKLTIAHIRRAKNSGGPSKKSAAKKSAIKVKPSPHSEPRPSASPEAGRIYTFAGLEKKVEDVLDYFRGLKAEQKAAAEQLFA